MKSLASSLPKSDKETLTRRFKKVQEALGTDAVLIEHPVDLFYLTGLSLSSGSLLIFKKEAYLFVDGRYFQEAKEKSLIKVALMSSSFFDVCLKQKNIKTIGFDSKETSYERFLQLRSFLKTFAGQGSPLPKLVPTSNLLKEIRSIKDRDELDVLRQSAALAWKGFLHIKKILKIGITEREVARSFELFCLKNGAQKLSFEPIIAFGENSAKPHHRSSDRILKKGDIVLIDIGVMYNCYASDMTRVLLPSTAKANLLELFEVVEESKRAALEHCRPGIAIGKLDEIARCVMKKKGLEELFVHSLGHGIGLQTHEFPRLSSKGQDKDVILKVGMVITVEPGLYLPGVGGVRLEDTVIITRTGFENLYPSDIGMKTRLALK
ncbi:MAG: M24 family metallopeptidase [Anaerolineae bacterium]